MHCFARGRFAEKKKKCVVARMVVEGIKKWDFAELNKGTDLQHLLFTAAKKLLESPSVGLYETETEKGLRVMEAGVVSNRVEN